MADPTGSASGLMVKAHETSVGLPAICDITEPANPFDLSLLDIAGSNTDIVHGPKLRGSRPLLSWLSRGTFAVDLAHREHPHDVGQFYEQRSPSGGAGR